MNFLLLLSTTADQLFISYSDLHSQRNPLSIGAMFWKGQYVVVIFQCGLDKCCLVANFATVTTWAGTALIMFDNQSCKCVGSDFFRPRQSLLLFCGKQHLTSCRPIHWVLHSVQFGWDLICWIKKSSGHQTITLRGCYETCMQVVYQGQYWRYNG
jgi:hypothetical protein